MANIDIQTVTVKQLQNTATETLEAISLTATNRQFSLACSLMAQAQKAFALGDKEIALTYGRKSATALQRAQESEHGQVRRVERTAAVIAEKF